MSGLPSLPVGRVRYHSLVSISSAGNFEAVRPEPAAAAAGAAAAGEAGDASESSSESSSDCCSSASRRPSSFASRTVSASALVSSTGDSSESALESSSESSSSRRSPCRRPCRRRPGRSRRGRRVRCRGGTGSGPPRRPHRPRTAHRRRRRRRRYPGAPGRNRPARAHPLRSARAGWPAAGGCSARDGLGGANAEPRTCLPKPRAGWTSGVGVRRAGGESRCPVPRPARSGFEEKPSGRFPPGCLRSGEVDARRDERWNPRCREGRAAPGRATSGRRVASGRHSGEAGAMLVGGTRSALPGSSTTIVKRTVAGPAQA